MSYIVDVSPLAASVDGRASFSDYNSGKLKTPAVYCSVLCVKLLVRPTFAQPVEHCRNS